MFRKVLGGTSALDKAVEKDTRECEESASLATRSGQCYATTKELSRGSGNVARLFDGQGFDGHSVLRPVEFEFVQIDMQFIQPRGPQGPRSFCDP